LNNPHGVVFGSGWPNLRKTTMPELPEVESVRRQLHPRVAGRRILTVTATPQARFAGLDLVAGSEVSDVDRRGKYLIARLDSPAHGPLDLVMHLGMTGSFRFRGDRWGGAPWRPDAYVRATLVLDDGVLDFRDVRRFGRLTAVRAGEYRTIPTLAALGPEPLSDAFDPDRFHAALAATHMAVKPYLLTQRPVAGVGNIYADEALWRARINPRARRVGRQRAHVLWSAIRDVLAAAIEREGTTFRDYLGVDGLAGRNGEFLAVYGRAGLPCPRCAVTLTRTVLAGRGTIACPACQRY
jgi:formamidopyrimidine-DNA glycosylase